MRERDFADWISRWYRTKEGGELDPDSQATMRSMVVRLESALGDLDAAWAKDRGAVVLARLEYSKDDERRQRPAPRGLRVVGRTYSVLASLRRAAVIYFEFCAAWAKVAPSSSTARTAPPEVAAPPTLRSASDLEALAHLLSKRNAIDAEISCLIHRPALAGHLGEFIASKVFGIELMASATNRGHDGYFLVGPLKGKSANVKCYAKREGLLDIRPDALPDYFLVLTGPAAAPASSVDGTRPFTIEEVFLFDARRLVQSLSSCPKPPKIGIATSVRHEFWEAARVFPTGGTPGPLAVSEDQAQLLRLFAAR